VDTAVQEASGGGKNVNDLIRQAAQIISKQASGVPLQNIESIIIQMALQTSKAQGKAITGQTIFDVANQIIRNPNGILTQAIIQLAKQDTNDGGKTGQTINVIKKVVEVSKGGGDSNGGGNGREGQKPITTQTQQGGQKPITTQTQPGTGLSSPTIGEIVGEAGGKIAKVLLTGLVNAAAERALGSNGPQILGSLFQAATNANPSVPQQAVKTEINDLVLRRANDAGESQAIQAVTNLQANMQ
jgi:hypothetical protein